MAIVAPLPNNGNGPCDIGNAWPMTMCDIRAMVSLKLKAKDSDQLESLYHPRQTHTWTKCLIPLPCFVLYVFILLRDGTKLRKTPREKSYLSDRWVCDRMIRLGKIETGSGRGCLFIKVLEPLADQPRRLTSSRQRLFAVENVHQKLHTDRAQRATCRRYHADDIPRRKSSL